MDQSTPAWRVFDQPAGPGEGGGASPGAAPTGSPTAAGVALASPNILLAVAAIVGALLIGGVALVVAIGGSGGATIDGPETAFGAFASETPAPIGGEIVVDVAGAVVKPGLYHLAGGARVGDAVDAAGGFGPRVDVDRVGRELNLAAALADGEQVRVPSRDDPTSGPGGGAGGGSGGDGSAGSGGSTGGLVNLNTATQAQLEELPGIGPVTAQKIIAAREEAPFRSVEELRERGLVGEKTFEDLESLVTTG